MNCSLFSDDLYEYADIIKDFRNRHYAHLSVLLIKTVVFNTIMSAVESLRRIILA